jgi:hypothetical protein
MQRIPIVTALLVCAVISVARVASAQYLFEDFVWPYNTAIGYQALTAVTTGDVNTASGFAALASNTSGSYNVASGRADRRRCNRDGQ